MMEQEKREPDEAIVRYRGCRLPAGMTPECAMRVESMVIDYIDDQPDYNGIFPLEFAIMLFEACRENPQASAATND